MGKRIGYLFVLVLLFASVSAMAYRGGGRNSNAQSNQKQKDFEWPGRYECEQCNGSAASAGASRATASAGCWKYELTVFRGEEKEFRGEVSVSGPDGDLDLKTHVKTTPSPALVEFHYVEPVDTSKKPLLTFGKDDLLFNLQHQEDDVLLRFKKLASKVAGQTVITCTKNK